MFSSIFTSPGNDGIHKICTLITAALILPALAYGEADHGKANTTQNDSKLYRHDERDQGKDSNWLSQKDPAKGKDDSNWLSQNDPVKGKDDNNWLSQKDPAKGKDDNNWLSQKDPAKSKDDGNWFSQKDNKKVPSTPEANSGLVLLPIAGAVLLLSWRQLARAKA